MGDGYKSAVPLQLLGGRVHPASLRIQFHSAGRAPPSRAGRRCPAGIEVS
jgi:hypothetical protein